MGDSNNLIQNQQRFTEKKFIEEDLTNPLVLDRKRRNSVTEFLRYYCRTEWPVHHNNNNIYGECLQHLKNGDIKTAVKRLNAQKKHKLALIVA